MGLSPHYREWRVLAVVCFVAAAALVVVASEHPSPRESWSLLCSGMLALAGVVFGVFGTDQLED